jgi:cellulose synthase/poly-beta-1,6-N-acetylglucosamine synthase-like glycosyltransferase
MKAPTVSVAVLNVGLHERIEHLLRVLNVRPIARVREIAGVGDVSPFPETMRTWSLETQDRATAKNAALRKTSGDFVLLLAGDTVVPPATVETLAATLAEHPQCALVSARLLLESGRLRAWDRRFPRLGRELTLHTGLWIRSLRLRYMLRGKATSSTYPVEWAPSLCAMVRREAFEQIGPWPEGYRFDFDDAAWCHRARERGWEIRAAREAFAHQLAPLRYLEDNPKEVVQGFEESLTRLIAEIKPGRSAAFHRSARRFRLRLARLGCLMAASCLLRRHESMNYRADATKWLLDWYAAGRPHVELTPTIEREFYWFGLM